jgi:uncharacterized membrane protein YagU involved in acid resistance
VFESVPSFRSKLHVFRLEWMKLLLFTVYALSFSLVVQLFQETICSGSVIGIIFLVQIFTILIPAWNVRFTKSTWYTTFCDISNGV